jgi:hypothetical protein
MMIRNRGKRANAGVAEPTAAANHRLTALHEHFQAIKPRIFFS